MTLECGRSFDSTNASYHPCHFSLHVFSAHSWDEARTALWLLHELFDSLESFILFSFLCLCVFNDLVEGSVVFAPDSHVISHSWMAFFVAMTWIEFKALGIKGLWCHMKHWADFVRPHFLTCFRYTRLLENIHGHFLVCHVSKQVQIIFGPELLWLLKKKARLDLRRLFGSALIVPILFALLFLAEFGQVTSVDANRYISKLRRVRGHHLFTPTQVKLLLSDPWWLGHRSVPKASILSVEHPVVRIWL